MSLKRALALLTTTIVIVAACTSAGSPTTASTGTGASAAPSAAAVVINAASTPSFGTVLTGANGMTLYTHAGDSATSSTCSGACATAWPPLAATTQPTAGAGVTGQLGTLTRSDGTRQVTYAGMPLYYWQGDKKAGDVTGNGIEGFAVATVSTAAAPAPQASTPVAAPSTSGGYSY